MHKTFRFLIFAALLFALTPTGCGSGVGTGTNDAYPAHTGPPLPASFGLDELRPNYGGDLSGTYFFPQAVITYRIVPVGQATDIMSARLDNVEVPPVLANDFREGLAKWQKEINKNAAAKDQRTFQPAADGVRADIDFVAQDSQQFAATKSLFYEQEGETRLYVRDTDKGYLGRAVIRVLVSTEVRKRRRTTLHEEGHALGFRGHSRRQGVIMQPISPAVLGVTELTEYDSNTMRANYTRDP